MVTRKSWGGNRTWTGVDTWQVLSSVLRTATQQARDPIELLARFCKRRHRSWPTSPSPGTDKHTRYLNTTSLRSLQRYARPDPEAVAALTAANDPARRRRYPPPPA